MGSVGEGCQAKAVRPLIAIGERTRGTERQILSQLRLRVETQSSVSRLIGLIGQLDRSWPGWNLACSSILHLCTLMARDKTLGHAGGGGLDRPTIRSGPPH